jgi:short-subunit dehydrogenase
MSPRTAFVTGASSGIGLALAERLAARGTTVVLAARRLDLLEDLRRRVEQRGGVARAVALDVADTAAVVAALEAADDELGGIDLVVANAGVSSARHGKKLDWAETARVLQVNAMGALATLTALLPRMVARGRGQLVGISSLAGIRGLPRSAAYSASKAALSTFLESLRIDLAGTGVRVSDVRPGFVDTPILAGAKHPTPFRLGVDDAVDRIVAGIDAGAPVVEFPLPLASALHLSRALPRPLFDAILRRAGG